jgi:drug/metabolite transporter (DMT)-like permease
MLAIVGGAVAAIAWGTATLCASRAAGVLGSRVLLGWVMLIGLIASIPILFSEPLPQLDGDAIVLLLLAGFGNVLGLLLAYTAFSTGKVSIAAPITSTEGAGAALIAILLGEAVGIPILLALGIAAVGVVLVSWERPTAAPEDAPPVPIGDPALVATAEREGDSTSAATTRRTAILAISAAALFAVGLYAVARIGAELGLGLTVLPSRLVGVVFVTLPLVLRRQLWITRGTLPLVITMGLLEVVGTIGIAVGARDAIAITAVISSQFAAVAVVGAYLLFGERLQRHQVGGIVLIGIGVAAVALLRALA